MKPLLRIWWLTWRSLVVAAAYVLGLMLAGFLGDQWGWNASAQASPPGSAFAMLASTLLLGFFAGPIAAKLPISRVQQFILWLVLIFFNLGSVALEGAFFAPDLVRIPAHFLIFQQFLATSGAAAAIAFLFTPPGPTATSWRAGWRARPWTSWSWRLGLGALSYVVFYWTLGGLNYALVTKPYYETHTGGLTVPAPEIVLAIEVVRGLLIVLSVLVFLLSASGTRRQVILATGWLLFSIGGIIPLCWQSTALPALLLVASGVEIFFQNVLTGACAAWLLAPPAPPASPRNPPQGR